MQARICRRERGTWPIRQIPPKDKAASGYVCDGIQAKLTDVQPFVVRIIMWLKRPFESRLVSATPAGNSNPCSMHVPGPLKSGECRFTVAGACSSQ